MRLLVVEDDANLRLAVTTELAGDNVEIRCDFANGANTLTRIEKRGH